jgi:hypothetical protein
MSARASPGSASSAANSASLARRTRLKSITASAIRQVSAWPAASAARPSSDVSMQHARATTSGTSEGSASTGTVRPCRRELRAATALPADDRGPVERSALRRLARILAALVMSVLRDACGDGDDAVASPSRADAPAVRLMEAYWHDGERFGGHLPPRDAQCTQQKKALSLFPLPETDEMPTKKCRR